MKKILFSAVLVGMTFFAADAQTKKTKSKKKPVSTEAKAKAEYAKIEKERQTKFEEQRLERLYDDSVSREQERLEEFAKDSARLAWKETKIKEADSMHNEKWKNQSIEKEKYYATERSQNIINKNAGLSENQGRQIKAINLSYNDKARVIRDNAELAADVKTTQLASLNEERRAKIRAILGKGKEKKLEKERKEYSMKFSDDIEAKWINDVADIKASHNK
jgi:hypothetical protein